MHAATKPVAVIPNCTATRHVKFELDGSGPATFEPPDLADWPGGAYRLLTGRDAAHKRLVDLIAEGAPLPVDFKDRFIYYVGPVDPVRDEVIGPAGPTTATRMDKFTRTMLEHTGLLGMIGKAERGPAGVDAIRDHGAVSLIAVGGAAYLIARAITKSSRLAFEDLGMEAIHEFEVKDMPVTVSVDARGESVHVTGPEIWAREIENRIAAATVD